MAFQLQTRRGQGSSEGQGKAHLAPGMHFRDLDTPGMHLVYGHRQLTHSSLAQVLDRKRHCMTDAADMVSLQVSACYTDGC